MRKLWDQMTGKPVKPKRNRLTHAQKDANYALQRMHQGKEFDIARRIERRVAKQAELRRERAAFQRLRQLGMI